MSVRTARLPAPLLGMALFIASEVVLFGSLLGAYFTLRARAPVWPPQGTPEMDLLRPAIMTLALAASSFTQHRCDHAHRSSHARSALNWGGLTLLLGALFIAGAAWEWSELLGEGFEVGTNVFATLFFTLTGAHGLHLVIGLTMIALGLARTAREGATSETAPTMASVTLYWHFVDVVWLAVGSSVFLLA